MAYKKGAKSFGIKPTYVSPLNKRLDMVADALYDFNNVTDALNKMLVLLESLTTDLQDKFKADISKLKDILLIEPNKATGITQPLRSEHAKQALLKVGLRERVYAHDLYARITKACDEKGWLESILRPRAETSGRLEL